MSDMNNCLNCKFAEWARTKNGRVNPRQAGRCTWTKTVRIPPYAEPSLGQNNGAIVFEGGYIWRDTPHEKCPTFQPAPR